MNERIKELYQRAHSIRHYDNDPSLAGNPPTVYWQGEVSAERFAELIVQECAGLFPAEYDTVEGKITIGKIIKQHFGVEE